MTQIFFMEFVLLPARRAVNLSQARGALSGRSGRTYFCGGGPGCVCATSRAGSRQAQAGALAAHMFIVGRTDDGSASVPARTTVNCGRPEEFENNCTPHLGQNFRVTWLPLSAVLTNSASSPEYWSVSD